ncbi:MAG: IS1380 family transposase, partial [Candidatus Competibacteraceae bacterium]
MSRYLSLSVEGGGTGIVSHAGAALLPRVGEKTGLLDELSRALAPWRKPLAIHDPGKIVFDLAVSVAIGGDCLADIAQLRGDRDVFGLVASDPTVSRLISSLAADAGPAVAAINTARSHSRANAWQAAGTVA